MKFLFAVALLSLFAEGGGAREVELPTEHQTYICETVIEEEPIDEHHVFYQAEENPIIVPADDSEDLLYLARTVWGEVGSVNSKETKMAVAWTVLNRVDSPLYPNTIKKCVTQRLQYTGYHDYYIMPNGETLNNKVISQEVVDICKDVLTIWYNGLYGRNLPKDYFGFDFRNGKVAFFKSSRAEADRIIFY